MNSPDEIKKGLECCSISYADCDNECPYKKDCDGSQILKDALALIQQYEKTIDNLAEANAAVHKKCDSLRLRVENREESLRHLNNLRDAAAGRALEMEERVHQLEAERDAMKEALGLMVYQYCVRGDKLDHLYMCAGETAFRVLGLEQYGNTRTLESWLFPEFQDKEE